MRNKKDLLILIGAFVFFVALMFFSKHALESYFIMSQISATSPVFFPFASIAALVDSINPCAFSVLLLTIAFLFNLQKSRKTILAVGGMYILGIFVVYLLIGLGILQALSLFGIPNAVSHIGAWLIILFGVTELIGHFYPAFPVKLKIPESTHPLMAKFIAKASFPSALVLGGLVGIFEFPCTGGPYLMILGLLHDHATAFLGFWYLIWYNFIFVLPLILVLFFASHHEFLTRVQIWRKQNTGAMRLYGGLAMVLLGCVILLF